LAHQVCSSAGLVFSKLTQSLVAIAHYAARPVPRAIIPSVIFRHNFARAITQNVPVKPGHDFALTIPKKSIIHIVLV
jgi:hypothetical protein